MTKEAQAAQPQAEGEFKMKAAGLGVAPMKRVSPLDVEWITKRVRVVDLLDYDRNPRTCSEAAFRRLKKSIRKTGYHTPILANADMRIVGGYQRRAALLELGVVEIDVRLPTRLLSDEEFKQVMIQSNLHAGKWDHDILGADFEIEDLTEWGMSAALIADEEPMPEGGGEAPGEAEEADCCRPAAERCLKGGK